MTTDVIGKAASSERAAIGRLAMLRRLYHHIEHGGSTTEGDFNRVGEPVTKANLSRLIGELEGRTSQAAVGDDVVLLHG